MIFKLTFSDIYHTYKTHWNISTFSIINLSVLNIHKVIFARFDQKFRS